MARFVMTNRRAGKFLEAQKKASRDAVETRFTDLFEPSADLVYSPRPPDDLARRVYVFDIDPREVSAKASGLTGDVIIEPEIPHWTQVERFGGWGTTPVGLVPQNVFHDSGGPSWMTVTVTASGSPMFGAELVLTITYADYDGDRHVIEKTDKHGKARLRVPATVKVGKLVVLPPGAHWSILVPTPADGLVVDCPSLPPGEAIDWWHRTVGIDTYDEKRGKGIKIGVVDSGVGPHPCLDKVKRIGAYIRGKFDPTGAADVDSHGSHVCGTIGARPVDPTTQRAGIAPGATLFATRVVPIANAPASQADITLAIDRLSRKHHVDLINLSLGAYAPSECNEDAIKDARERGTLCICAGGNGGGALVWPAALPEAVAVTALGDRDVPAPADSLSANRLPASSDRYGVDQFFLAKFSSFGAEADAAAPGVGVISTVPERFGLTAPYAVMDGTSMASPIVCGTLAVLLAASSTYKTLTGAARAEEARAILRNHCASAGLAARFQGHGVPRIP